MLPALSLNLPPPGPPLLPLPAPPTPTPHAPNGLPVASMPAHSPLNVVGLGPALL